MSQFTYKRIEKVGETEKVFTDSFNLNKVIRSMEIEGGKRIVALDDIHERLQEAPQFNTRRDKIVGYTKQRNTFQSEITLDKEDSERFLAVVSEFKKHEFC